MPATATPAETAELINLVDRFLDLYDSLSRMGRSDRRRHDATYRDLERDILSRASGLALTRGGRSLVPIGLGAAWEVLKVVRFRDLDMEEFVDHERQVLDACARAIAAGTSAAAEDLAVVAGEIRRLAECSEREALEAARDLVHAGPAPPLDIDALGDMARELVDQVWHRRRPVVVDGPPFEDDSTPLLSITEDQARALWPGPRRD